MTRLAAMLLGPDAGRRVTPIVSAHAVAAAAFGMGLGLPITPMELAGVPLIVIAIVRLRSHAVDVLAAARSPFAVALLAWLAWAFIALAWSPDRPHGLDELASARWLWLLIALAPYSAMVRPTMIGIAAGFVLMHASQAVQLAGQSLGIEALTFGHLPDRVSGWSEPAVAGSLLCAVFGLHLPRALFASNAWRTRILAVLALVGLIATGTRGAWIVAAIMLGTAATLRVVSGIRSSASKRPAIIACALALAVGAVVTIGLGSRIASRVDEARSEIAAALDEGNYHTSTGGRIIMLSWAIEAVRDRPISGVGTGGYEAWVNAQQAERGIDPTSQRVLAHAHNAYLHIAAVQGAVGVMLMLSAAAFALRNAWPTRLQDAGTAAAITGMLLIAMFDAVHINAQTSALLMTLATMALARRRRAEKPDQSPPPTPA
ncbi:MAG: O-antigen ligase family protein [Planctomycetota bacterium]